MTAKQATVVRIEGKRVYVRCPYCGNEHVHELRAPGPQHRAPGCGLTRSGADRLAGYRFTIARPSGTNGRKTDDHE